MFTVTKSYRDFPAAHRQHNHDGHCAWIHGHNWGFDIVFTCTELDECGFVVDVGKLDWVKKFLKDNFDHTLLLNENDPQLKKLQSSEYGLGRYDGALANIIVVPNCGMEGLAKFVFDNLQYRLKGLERGLRVSEVTCWEDSKNCALYHLETGHVRSY